MIGWAVIALMFSTGGEPSVLTLRVVPMVCLSPCDVRATVKVDGSRDGDVMKVEWESEEYHSSFVNIAEGRKTYQMPLVRMSGGGQGVITVTLQRRDGSTWTAVSFIELRNGEME